VTVRHHLGRLQDEGLVTTAELRRKHSPGRPQHIYSLTPQAEAFFPNNYQRLVAGLLSELRRQLPPEGVNVILEGVAQQWASELDLSDMPVERRMDAVVEYLNGQGYSARWEPAADGVVLHTSNCPYHLATNGTLSLCDMDMRLVASLVGVAPRRLSQMKGGDETCSYHIPVATTAQS
jgi:predicted ArsR family transcriptional regulator